jgi:hypothetical protein
MFRGPLVGVLTLSLLVGGCSHYRATAASNTFGNQPAPTTSSPKDIEAAALRKYSWQDRWIENHPVLNTCADATAACLLGAACVVGGAAFIVGSALAHGEPGTAIYP